MKIRIWVRAAHFVILLGALYLLPAFGAEELETRTVRSLDGVPVEYVVGGTGNPVLVFVHGWTCDRGYWSEQLSHFSEDFRVLAVDLAGHGASGSGRDDYSMASFGADVAAAADGDFPVILIGHSMGASVMLEAAKLMGERIVGMVAVDSLQDVSDAVPSPASIEAQVSPLVADYEPVARSFIESMFLEDADEELRDRIVEDMLSTDTDVAVSAIRGLLEMDYASAFAELDAPLVLINSTLWPTDMDSLEAMYPGARLESMDGVGHFLMMESPDEFNAVLETVIESMIGSR